MSHAFSGADDILACVKRIVAEPTAAALAYGLDKKKNEKPRI